MTVITPVALKRLQPRKRAISLVAGSRVKSVAGTKSLQVIAGSVSSEGGDLVERVSALIDQAQSFAAAQVNKTLTLRYWCTGRMIDVAVLHEDRAGYDQELVASLGRQLMTAGQSRH